MTAAADTIDLRDPDRYTTPDSGTPTERAIRASAAITDMGDLMPAWSAARRQAVRDMAEGGMSVREIADALDLSTSQVQRIRGRAPWTRAEDKPPPCPSFRGSIAEPCVRCGRGRTAHLGDDERATH